MSLQQLANIDWAGALKVGGVIVAFTLGYASIDNRIAAVETHKAERTDVEVIKVNIEHIKESVDRIERKIDKP